MKCRGLAQSAIILSLSICAGLPALAQNQKLIPLQAHPISAPPVPSRVVEEVNDARMVKLAGNTHPMARPEFEIGALEPAKVLDHMVLVLKRSPEQEAALAAFNERQYDPKSPDYHRWIQAEEFGKLYGPSDADMAAVTSWLQNHGFTIDVVSKSRISIQFSGTVAQVQSAFKVEMHNYLVENEHHIANDRDPSIPEALSPVVTGIASLHDWFPKHQGHRGDFVRRDMKTGKYTVIKAEPGSGDPLAGGSKGPGKAPGNPKELGFKSDGVAPEVGYVDPSTGYQREELGPWDVATIYNILPLWNASTPINGAGVTVAIIAVSDVNASDFNTYRSSFGLPATTLVVKHGSAGDPGEDGASGQGENTEDVEMASATAPGATIMLVSTANSSTTAGPFLSIAYIADNNLAPIMTGSYGQCELALGSAGNSVWNQTWQQAATAGISIFESAGDQGAAGCNSQNGNAPYGDTSGLQVNGIASSPYLTAVGGTDLAWPFSTEPYTTWWNSTNGTNGVSAKGYMPETTWNTTCANPLLLNVYTDGSGSAFPDTASLCNAAAQSTVSDLVVISAGSGGVSKCTAPTGTTPSTCAGGYAKPSWQTGSGVPADGKRDMPDVSFFASYGFRSSTGLPGSALLICQASNSPTSSCNYSADYINYQENGGTSAASPLTAGIMALIVQKTGSAQGLANPMYYKLAAKQNYSSCNSSTVAAGNSCVFYDTTAGTNAQVCEAGAPSCVTTASGQTYGVQSGYSAVTGYDTSTGLGTPNVTNLVNAWAAASTGMVSLTPASFTFPSTAVGVTSPTSEVSTLKNTGTVGVTLNTLTLNGAGASSYGVSTTCGQTLAVGASCTFTFTFDPQSTGTQSATFTVTDNAGTGSQSVTLSGTGANTTAPAITLSPTTLTFASTVEGVTTAAQVVTVKNTGTAAATLTSETITGTNTTSFVKSATTCGTSLAVSATCTVSVEFKPAATGALTANLSVADNATGTPQTVKLTGTGTTPTLTVSVTPATLTFPSTAVGATSAAQVVTVKNTGTSSVTLTSETLTGTSATSFVKSATTCGTTLAAAATCTVSVEFKPASSGAKTASLSVADNATGTPQTVSLTGTGTTATTVTLSPSTLTFASTKIGTTSAAQVVTLKNTGTTTVTISSGGINFTGSSPTSFTETATTCATTLAASASCTISVAFKPLASGAVTANLSVTDNAAGSPQTVALSGTGATASVPVISLSATSLAFPATITGTTSDALTVTVSNTGSAAATLTSIALSGTNAASFQQIGTCGATLAAGANCAVYVAFKPTATGAQTATLSVTDNASGSPQKVTLTGTGAAAPSVKLSVTTLAFGTVKSGTTSPAKTVTLTNSGTATLTLTSITLTGTNPTSFEALDTCGATLAPAAACTVYVAFKPAAAGADSASLTVTDNGSASPQKVALTGTGD